MRSEAHNTDCIEFMRSLPDKCFSLAVCDPPYGKGNDESLVGGRVRFGQIFDKYFTPSRGGVNPKPRNGMSPLRRSSSMNFSV